MAITMEELADKARENLPDALVTHALQLVYLGAVQSKGGNVWDVEGYEVNHFTKTCTCTKRVHVHEKWGKLCEHHIAVMLERRYQDYNKTSNTTFDEKGKVVKRWTIEELFAMPDLNSVWIEYNYETGSHKVAGYTAGRQKNRLPQTEWFSVKYERFVAALAASEYSLRELPEKMSGFDYFYEWRMRHDKIGTIPTEAIWTMKSVTSAMVKANRRKELMEEIENGK